MAASGSDGRRTDEARSDGGVAGRTPSDDGEGTGRAAEWVLLRADRHLLTGLALLSVFLAILAVGSLPGVSLSEMMRSGDPVETLFQAMTGAIVTGVTLVVTINQLVLSQELGPVGDQRQRMEGAISFRDDLEDALEREVSPAAPGPFLGAVLDAVRQRANRVAERATEGTDAAAFGRRVAASAERTSDRLAGAEFGTFDVVDAALSFQYAHSLHETRRFEGEAADGEADLADALGSLADALALFAPAREHVKTLYFQWELIDLSRSIVYAAVPALTVSVAMILFAGSPDAVTGATLGVTHLLVLVAAAATVTVAPFVLLLSYLLRIGTVAKRTLAIGPFVLEGDPDSQRE